MSRICIIPIHSSYVRHQPVATCGNMSITERKLKNEALPKSSRCVGVSYGFSSKNIANLCKYQNLYVTLVFSVV